MWLMEICASSLTAWTLTSKKVWQRSWTEHHPKSLRSWRTFALATLSNLTRTFRTTHMNFTNAYVSGPTDRCFSQLRVIFSDSEWGIMRFTVSRHQLTWKPTRSHSACKCLTLTTCDVITCFQVWAFSCCVNRNDTHTFSRVSYWEFVRFLSPPTTETMHAAPQRHVTWKHDKAVVSLNIEQ